jgi:cobyrinic acid a,c-diamide synthase
VKELHLHLDHLAVDYRGKALIKDIEIGVERGEIVTLIGPNGSGKSTILKSITRQLVPVGGDVLLKAFPGKDSGMKSLEQFSPEELAREMAVVLTGRIQTELMTCRDIAAMGRYPYTGRLGILSEQDEQKVEEALAAVHAQELSSRPFEAVSDGERQRILLARAICQEPEIIVLDEPTSYLDIRHKLELLSILRVMARNHGITVVMSLHEIDLAMKISDRVICVKGDRIFACGRPGEILNDEVIRKLYDLDPRCGSFDTKTGSIRLPQPEEDEQRAAEGKAAGKTDAEGPAAGILRFMIAAPGSGSGKTLITCGLLRLLKRHGLRPAAFKCGPDYIDPMFHRKVLGIPSGNLDMFFSPGDAVKDVFRGALRRHPADIAVIEGVMGYFDGAGASGMEASSFDLAKRTDTPVILVVRAKGMARSIVPLLKGLADYEGPGGKIRGVILNCVTKSTAARMKQWIEEETKLRVAGYLPQDSALSWDSRHLGLLQPEELKDLDGQLDRLADLMEETIDTEVLLSIAGAEGRRAPEGQMPEDAGQSAGVYAAMEEDSPVIAVARDEAFSFYYEENLEVLRECGARIEFFSPLYDSDLPEADGLLIGGGYPELHAAELEANTAMREQIRAKAAEGMPVLAECGGFMYLQEYLEVPGAGEEAGKREAAGGRFRMCGVLPGSCRKTDRLVRFGYAELSGKTQDTGKTTDAGYLPAGHRIRGHEFHYYDSTDNGDACLASKPGNTSTWDCMTVHGNVMAGFPHLWYRSDPAFAAAFVERCRERRKGKG